MSTAHDFTVYAPAPSANLARLRRQAARRHERVAAAYEADAAARFDRTITPALSSAQQQAQQARLEARRAARRRG